MKKVITVGHSKGGTTKSTFAWNLAGYLESQKEKVTIIDLDFQQTLLFVNAIRKTTKKKPFDVIKPKTGSELIELVNKSDGYIIIDLGGYSNDINNIALDLSDEVIIPISNSITEVIGFKTFEKIIKKTKAKSINILLSNIHPLATNFKDIIKATSTINAKLLNSIVRTRKTYRDTMGKGLTVFDIKDDKSQEEIRLVFKGLGL